MGCEQEVKALRKLLLDEVDEAIEHQNLFTLPSATVTGSIAVLLDAVIW